MAEKNQINAGTALIVFAALAMSVILLAGCTGAPQPVVKPTVANNTGRNNTENGNGTLANSSGNATASEGCLGKASILDIDNCYFNESVSTGDASMCGRITNPNIKDDCVYALALNDTKLCSQIVSEMKRDACLELAAETKNSSAYCNAIENETLKAECMGIANPPCAGIDDPSNKTLCLALDKNDITVCTDSPAPNDCMLQYAIQRENLPSCSVITNAAYSSACQAIISSDMSYCENPTINTSRDLCYELYAFNKNDVTACGETTKEFYIDDCWQTMAERNKDPTLCKNLYTEPARDGCYTDMATVMADASLCTNIPSLTNRDGCAIATAKATVNPGDCGYATNGYERIYVCCLEISTNPDYLGRLSAQGCRNINFDDSCKANCFFNVAQKLKDTTLCKEIPQTSSNQYLINQCDQIGNVTVNTGNGYLYGDSLGTS